MVWAPPSTRLAAIYRHSGSRGIHIHEVGIDGLAQRACEWAQAGATHISIAASDAGLTTVDALTQAAQALWMNA